MRLEVWVLCACLVYGGQFSISQVHLSYSYTSPAHTSMYLTWNTHLPANYCSVYYTSPHHTHLKYSLNYTHDLSIDNYPNFVYKTHMQDLAFDTEYHYTIHCISGALEDYRIGSFHSHPGYRDNVTLLILGDWATAGIGDKGHSQHTQTVKPNILPFLTQETDYSSLWHLGDLAYNLHSHSGKRGDDFLTSLDPIISHKPFMAVPGNHEIHKEFQHYNARFEYPSLVDHNLYYSLDIGKAHIVMICTDFEATVPGRRLKYPEFQENEHKKQMKWLLNDLEMANNTRSIRPWLLVMGHKPLYCSSNPKSDMMERVCIHESAKMREKYEDIFVKYRVNVYFAGHLHLYERMKPVLFGEKRKKQVESKHVYYTGAAPIYIVNGVAGNLEKKSIIMQAPDQPLSISAHISESLGYGFLHIFNSSHILYEQVAYGSSQYESMTADMWKERRVEDFVWVVNRD